MADQTYDVEKFATHLGNAVLALSKPGGQDPTGITPTGDIISQVGQSHPAGSAQMGYNAMSNVTPMTGSLSDGTYDGYTISQEYGVGGHPGIDIGIPVGTPLVSPFGGTVTHAGNDDPGGYGAWVEITGDDGTVIRYGHLSSIGVQTGQRVDPGAGVGLSGGEAGSTGAGNASGPHLHFEVHQGGPTVDPSSFLAGGWQILGNR